MTYKKYKMKITPTIVTRYDNKGVIIKCDGFNVSLFKENETTPSDIFDVAVGYEILNNSIDETIQLVKDYINMEEKNKLNQIK